MGSWVSQAAARSLQRGTAPRTAQAAGAAGAPGADAGNAGSTGKPDDGVVDADYEEVKD